MVVYLSTRKLNAAAPYEDNYIKLDHYIYTAFELENTSLR